MSSILLPIALAFTAAITTQVTLAQDKPAPDSFPNRPLRLIIPYAPAGATDIVGRIVAQKLTERLSQQVLVDNRPGAGAIIGSEIIAKSAPDGYSQGAGRLGQGGQAVRHPGRLTGRSKYGDFLEFRKRR